MSTQGNDARPSARAAIFAWLACLVALGSVAGSVYLSMGMGRMACPLCFYQRTLVLATLGVLLVGLFAGLRRSGLCLLALPLAVAGLGVAGWHVYLELGRGMQCPEGILGIGTAPQESLAALSLLTLLLVLGGLSGKEDTRAAVVGTIATSVLGLLFAAALVLSAAPQPDLPDSVTPDRMCRFPRKA
jgi:disulfide bond formation protein DsbB